jgi:hypothetical protein
MFVTKCYDFYKDWLLCISNNKINDCCKPSACKKYHKKWMQCKANVVANVYSER